MAAGVLGVPAVVLVPVECHGSWREGERGKQGVEHKLGGKLHRVRTIRQ